MKNAASLILFFAFVVSHDLYAQTTRPSQGTDIFLGRRSELTEADKEFAAKFNLVRSSIGRTPDGYTYTENTYRGPDEEKVYFRTVHYHSTERAKAEFDNRVKTAIAVSDQAEAKRDDGGTDEMAVATIPGENQKQLRMIIVKSGEDFRTVRSNSNSDISEIAAFMKSNQKQREEARPE